jgi:hypothetical protein
MKLILSALSVAVYVMTATAPAQQAPQPAAGAVNFTAKSANVTESGTPVRINLLRWSTDEERNSIVEAINPTAPAAGSAGRGGAARGGRGGRGGRGAAQADSPDDVAPDPALADIDGGGGRGGRGGRGAARGARGDAPAAPPNPIASLTAAIGKAPTLGYIWTNEVVGYSIKYAYHAPSPDGGERIILATDRRLGGYTPSWKLVAASTPTDYEFTVIEIRLDAKGLGEGKTSLTTKVIADNDAKTIALENYPATASMLQSVKR